MEFHRCIFQSCGLSLTRESTNRTVARDIRLTECEVRNCVCGPVVVEGCVIDGLKTRNLFQLFGAVFKHVIFRGKIGRVMFSPLIQPGIATAEEQRAFDSANEEYYKTVDWAIDIRHAQFQECDLRGVPARLVLRDENTQVLVRRVNAVDQRWRDLDLSGTDWPGILDVFLHRGDAEVILIAPTQAKNAKQLIAGLQLLREHGVAE